MYIVNSEQVENIYNHIKNFEIYSFEGETIIDPAVDIGDILIVDGKRVLFQGELDYAGKFKANIKSKIQAKTEQESMQTKQTNSNRIKKVQSEINQIDGKITQLTQETSDNTQKIAKHETSINEISNKVSNIADLTKTITDTNTIILDNCANGELLRINIYGNNTVFSPLVLNDNLCLSNSLYLRDYESILIVTDEKGNATNYDLKIKETLRQKDNIKDEYILDGGKAKIIRRINKDGTIKDSEEIEELGKLNIILEQGTNTIEIKDYSAEIQVKWAQKSDLTDTFATKVELHTNISQTSANIMAEVNKKVDDKDFGTKIEQNYENVKLAWNQISEFIQMMIIKNNASFAILDKDKKISMALDKTGQHFYDSNQNILGDMGVKQVKEFDEQGQEQKYDYITFSIPTQYGSYTKQGMAWGVETPDGKFFPVMFIKDFYMANQESGDFGGQVVLNNCDLVIGETSGITNNSVKMSAEPTGELIFTSEVNEPINLLTLYPEGHYLNPYSALKMLDKILFYKNSAGTNTFKIGDDTNYCMFTDDGKIYGNEVGSTRCEITAKDIQCFGHIYCNNGVESFSTREKKKKIRKYKKSAIKEILNTDIYYFNYKEDPKNAKRRIGTIIGDNYKCSKDIISQTGQSISDYSMISLAYKAIQEQQQQIEELQNKIKILEDKINEKN